MKTPLLIKFALVFLSVLIPISFFQAFDFFFSKNTTSFTPFILREPKTNGKPLIISDEFGWYDLGPDFYGESRYGDNYFFVKTDKNGFRINHLLDEDNFGKDGLKNEIIFIGDSFTFGVGLDWEEGFVGILKKDFNINAINAGVNSHSPTAYKFKLKRLINEGLISNNQKIVIGLDISDVFDEATRWTEFQGKPADIRKVNELTNKASSSIKITQNLVSNNEKKKRKNFYNENNFKLTHQIYYGIENFIKKFIDDIQVRNNDRSKFTHQDWEVIHNKFSPLGVEKALEKITNNLSEISQLTSENNNELYLLIYPWPAQLAYKNSFDWPKYIEKKCIEINCAGVINTFPGFFSFKENSRFWQKELYIRGDMHFNKKGNYILAEVIASEFSK